MPPANAPPQADPDDLGRRARRGAVLLVARLAVVQLIVLGGMVLLARLLDPADFGVFAIAQFAIQFFAFFGEAGLGAALVQKKNEPAEDELSSLFLAQLGLSLGVVALVFATAELLPLVWRDLPPGATVLVRALSLGLVLTCLRTVPAMLMERELAFGRLALLDVVTSCSFYVCAVALASMGFGVAALVLSTLAQGLLGVLLAYAMRPWRPRLHFEPRVVAPMLRFGVAFQLKNLVGFVNGAVSPLYAGVALGPAAVGLINWSQTTAFFPLKLVEVLSRVTFPLYSRMQGDRDTMAESLGRSIQICASGVYFVSALLLALGPGIISVIYTEKWMPALPLLRVYAIAILAGFLAPLVASALDATGRPQIFMKLSIGWTSLNWLLAVVLTPRYGIQGFVLGYAASVVLGNLVVVLVTRRLLPGARPTTRLRAPLIAFCATALAGDRLVMPWVADARTLVLGAALLLALFASVVLLLDRRNMLDAFALIPGRSAA